MAFADDLARFAAKVRAREQAVFVNTAAAVKDSVVNGSAITSSPGQPVDTGALRASWNLSFESPTTALISTNIEYAKIIEDNTRGATLRSAVGGFHSVKLTVAGFPQLLAAEVAKVAG